MMNTKALKDAATRQAFKLMQNPKVMKLVTNPKVMGTVMKAMQARQKWNAAVEAQVVRIAHRFHLVTEKEVSELRRTIRELERRLEAASVPSQTLGGSPSQPTASA